MPDFPPDGYRPHLSRRLARWVVTVGALLTLAVLLHAGAPWEDPVSTLGGLAALVLWCVSPYAGLAGALRLARSPGQEVLVLVASLLTAGFGALVLGDVLVVHRGLVNALATLAVPPVQWGIVIVTILAVLVWRALASIPGTGPRPPEGRPT
ncbi:MAG: hypothetical protein MUF10_00620 [Thermoanaerobaculaceae bacterium]|jgi:hypothetical protein|nr:hypothetical protein [Thermoanaerobaculaceae bacterium]